MEYTSLLLLHVFFAIIWGGGAIAIGFFVLPAVLEAGPPGGAVMTGVVKRRFPLVMTASGFVVVLSGLRLYMLRFDPSWLTSPEGVVLSLGSILGIGALAIGFFVQKPTVEKLGALAAKVATAGVPPTPEQTAELSALRARVARMGKVIGWHLVGAALLMASHTLAAGL